MKNYIKSAKIEIEESYKKPNLIVFDFDGCIANSDDFVLTNSQAYQKELEIALKNNTKCTMQKPNASNKNDFCQDYLRKHHSEIQPYFGVFDLFVKLSMVTKVAIVTSRHEILLGDTQKWIEQNTIKYYNEQTWRQMFYQTYFNDSKVKSLQFKQKKLTELMDAYNILLLIEDHPQVIEWAKKKNIEVLVPATGYKNLNGQDLMPVQIDSKKVDDSSLTKTQKKALKELSLKPAIPIRELKKAKKNDNLQKK